MEITLNKNRTLDSVEYDKHINVSIERMGRKLPYPFFRNTLDQYDLYRKELGGCENFRLITSISPYCSNVLFNPLTEVAEGNHIHNWKEADFTKKYVWSTQKTTDPNYKYYFGSDIFSNHLLRNISFKAVNNGGGGEIFNTMRDAHRNRTGKEVDKSLYEFGDCMSFIVDKDNDEIYNCMDYELRCIDGWYGFNNKSNIQTKSNRDYNNKARNCSSVVGCETGGKFIQLYPTKDEFLFNPVYNESKQRAEYNWDICLTYPYKSYTNHELVQDGDWNGLLVKSVIGDGVYTPNGRRGFLISVYVKHNMELGDHFTLSYRLNDTVAEPYQDKGEYLSVIRLGDLLGKNKEYTFLVSEDQMKNVFGDVLYENDEYIGDRQVADKMTFRFRKLRRNVESVYYFRVFRKLPNFKYAQYNLDISTVKDEQRLDEYLKSIESGSSGFDNEMYPLGFSQTVYNDNNTQITFTDTISPDILVDNLGRPLSEIYVTVVKANRGYREWYEGNVNNDNVEVSHCFGEVSMGIKCEERYSNILKIDTFEKKFDIRALDDTKDADGNRVNGLSFECNGEKYGNVTINDRYFLGDVVEFNAEMIKEYQLSTVYHRFNTWQREHIDDFALPFENIDSAGDWGYSTTKVGKHLEGYYYEPHYRVQLKEFGDIKEGEHLPLSISRVNRYDKKGENDKSAVDKNNHNCYLFRLYNRLTLSKNDFIRIRIGDMFYKLNIVYAPNSMSFVVDVSRAKTSSINDNVIWKDATEEQINQLKNFFQDKDIIWKEFNNIWRENPIVPWYAIRHPMKENRYVWRVIHTYGDINCKELDNSVVFANGHIYLNHKIDFFLQRQDPYGYYGKLYTGDIPDITGDKMVEPPTKDTPFNGVIC